MKTLLTLIVLLTLGAVCWGCDEYVYINGVPHRVQGRDSAVVCPGDWGQDGWTTKKVREVNAALIAYLQPEAPDTCCYGGLDADYWIERPSNDTLGRPAYEPLQPVYLTEEEIEVLKWYIENRRQLLNR